MEVQFKKCSLVDLDDLVEISSSTFVEAFEKDNNPEDFKIYIDSAFHIEKIREQLDNPDSHFYFVYSNNILVAYFKLNVGQAQTDIKSEESMELERIYVRNEHQGKQIGGQILQEAVSIASAQNKLYIWLGVWQKNVHAIRFYEKQGFIKFGTHPYYIGKDKQIDWLLRYDLTNLPKD